MDANSAEHNRRRREDSPAQELRRRIDSLIEDEDGLSSGCGDALRAVAALIVNGGDLDGLTEDQIDGLEWLTGLVELENGTPWLGGWHVDNGAGLARRQR